MKKTIIVLAVIMAIGLVLRIVPHLSQSLTPAGVLFPGTDTYYHLYLADYTYNHWPDIMTFDPLSGYPAGRLPYATFMLSWLIATVALIFHTSVNNVALYLPPILGVAAVIPVYFIGKMLWARWVGLLMALLLVVMPSEALHRSFLGYADHHVLEILLSLSVIAMVIRAQNNKWLIYSALAGVCLGLFYLTWVGALALSCILTAWALIDRKQKTSKIALVVNTVALLISFWYVQRYAYIGLAANMGIVFMFLAWQYKKKLLIIPVAISMSVALGLQYLQVARIFNMGFNAVAGSNALFIGEGIKPDAGLLFLHFGMFLLLAMGGVFLLIWKRQHVLIIIWCALWLFMMFAKARWDYYATTSIVFASGYLFYTLYQRMKVKQQIMKRAVIVVLLIVCFITLVPGSHAVANARPQITQDWQRALTWVRDNTPEYQNAKPDYGILSWWDYGYWIIREGQRAPLSSPGRQKPSYSKFFTATTYDDAMQAIKGKNVKYVVIDDLMMTGKYYAIAMYSGYKFSQWNEVLSHSFADRLYGGLEPEPALVYQSGKVKVFEVKK